MIFGNRISNRFDGNEVVVEVGRENVSGKTHLRKGMEFFERRELF